MIERVLEILLVSSFFGICVVVSEILFRLNIPALIVRKTTHVLSSIATISIPILLNSYSAVIMFFILILLNLLSNKLKFLKGIENGIQNSAGSIYFPIGALLSYLVFMVYLDQIDVYILGILVLGFADGLASVVGTYFGKHKIKISKNQYKSIEGSLAFLIITMIIFLLFFMNSLIINPKFLIINLILILFGSFLITLIELYNGNGKDNIYIPFSASIVAYSIIFINTLL